jgi:hypothetical protein
MGHFQRPPRYDPAEVALISAMLTVTLTMVRVWHACEPPVVAGRRRVMRGSVPASLLVAFLEQRGVSHCPPQAHRHVVSVDGKHPTTICNLVRAEQPTPACGQHSLTAVVTDSHTLTLFEPETKFSPIPAVLRAAAHTHIYAYRHPA